jgi:hypothetical protein
VSTMTGLQPYSFGLSLPFMPTPPNMAIAPFVGPPAPVPASYYAPPAVAPSPLPATVYTPPPFPSAPIVETLPPPAVANPLPDAEFVSDSSSGPVHLTNMITARLSPDNYLLWRAQIFPLLRSRHLDGYIDGTLPCPPKLVSAVTTAGARVSVPNPAYRAWVAQVQLYCLLFSPPSPRGLLALCPSLSRRRKSGRRLKPASRRSPTLSPWPSVANLAI